jgi:hypothetical protein
MIQLKKWFTLDLFFGFDYLSSFVALRWTINLFVSGKFFLVIFETRRRKILYMMFIVVKNLQ